MAGMFECFSLEELIAKPEDAFRLASLAAAQGREVKGYCGTYHQLDMGDARLSVRTINNYETGELDLSGMDISLLDAPIWELEVAGDVTDERLDPLSRTLLLRRPDGEGLFAADVVNADVLPCFTGRMRLGVSAQAVRLDYLPADTAPSERLPYGVLVPCGYLMTTQSVRAAAVLMDPITDLDLPQSMNYAQLRGIVKSVKVGETDMGMEAMTYFIRTTVETIYGDLEICHPITMVPEDQKDLVKEGSVVSLLCAMVADAAVEGYAKGVEYGEAQDLSLLRHFFENGGADRLRPALHSNCEYISEYSDSRLDGIEETIALLKDVEAALDEESRYYAYPAHIVSVDSDPDADDRPAYSAGKPCLLLAQGGPEKYVAICFIETDSVGRIRTIYLSRDGRYNFMRDDLPIQLDDAEAPADALEAMMPWMIVGGLLSDVDLLLADKSRFPEFEERAKAGMEKALEEKDFDAALQQLFGQLYAETAGKDAEKGAALYEGFANYPRLAKPDVETYQQQLLNALVIVQRLGELNCSAD